MKKFAFVLALVLAAIHAPAQSGGGGGAPSGGGGGGSVVNSINGTSGVFTFSGAGVSCTTTTCTFSGTGTGIGSIAWTVPSFMTANPSTISASGTQIFTFNSQANHLFLGNNTGSSAAPVFTQPTLADIAAGASPSGLFDFSGATQIKLPVAALYASAANGEAGYDSTNLNWHIWNKAADNFIAVFPVASPPTSGDCVNFLLTGNTWTLQDAGAACGTGSTTLTFPATVAGTTNSGGIPYFSNTTTLTSSAALTQHGLLVGGGAGGAPTALSVGGANFPLIGQASANPAFSTIAYPTSLTSGGILYGSSTTALASSAALTAHGVVVGGGAGTAPTSTAAGTSGQCLTSNGASADPTFQTCGVGAGVSSFTGDTHIITNSASTGAVSLTIAGTSGGIPYFSSTSAWQSSGLLASKFLMLGGGAGSAPTTDTGCSTDGAGNLTCSGYSTGGSLQGFQAYAVGTGSLAGFTLPTNYVGFVGPASGTPTYFLQLPSATPSAQVLTCAAPSTVNGVSQSVCTWTSGGTGTVTSIATTGPIGGGTITTTGTITCATCVVASSPGAGIAHFAGSTQTVTSSAVSLTADVTGVLPVANGGWGSNFAAHTFFGNTGGSAASPAASTLGAQDVSPGSYVAGGGTAQAQTATLSPAVTSLTPGLTVRWLPTAANTAAAPTLAVNGLTATAITKLGTAALVANDLTTTAIATAVYDGTEFQLQNPQTAPTGGVTSIANGGTNASSAAAGTVPNATSGSAASWTATPTLGVAGTTNGTLTLASSTATGSITLTPASSASAFTVTIPGATDTLVNLGSTQTLTAKTLTSPVLGGTPDASGATQFKLPVGAGFTTAANGEIGYDSTNLNFHIWQNGSDSFIATFPVATPPTTGHCVQFLKSTNTWTLSDAGAACGSGGGSSAESSITAPVASNTITETAAGDWTARVGAETANLTTGWSITDGNSSNNNTNVGFIAGATGTSTGEIGEITFDVSGVGDLHRWYTGGSITSNAYAPGTLEAHLDNAGNFTANGSLATGTAPSCTSGSASALCQTTGTGPSAAASVGDFWPNSADNNYYYNVNNGTTQHLQQQKTITSAYTNATTSATNITGLSFAVAANTTYQIHCWGLAKAASTGGLELTVTGPSTPTLVTYAYTQIITLTGGVPTYNIVNSTGTAYPAAIGTAYVTTTTDMPQDFYMQYTNGATSGTWQLQGISAAAVTTTVEAGFTCSMQ